MLFARNCNGILFWVHSLWTSEKNISFWYRTVGFLKDNESSPSGTITVPHWESLKTNPTCDITMTQNCYIFCQLLKVQSHSSSTEQLLYWFGDGNKVVDCFADGADWGKKKSDWRKKWIGCFEVSASTQKVKFASLLLFICAVRMERKLSRPFYRVHVLLKSWEGGQWFSWLFSQESQTARLLNTMQVVVQVGRYVFSWAVIQRLWERERESFWSISDSCWWGNINLITFSKHLPVFPVAGSATEMVWDWDGLRGSGTVWQHRHSVTQGLIFSSLMPDRKRKKFTCIFMLQKIYIY